MVEFAPVVAPPGGMSYAAGLMDFGPTGSGLNTLLSQFEKVQDIRRNNAFSENGLPYDEKTGNLDLKKMAQTYARLGDPSTALKLANAGIGQQNDAAISSFLNGGGIAPGAGTPANILPPGYGGRVASAESGGDPNARNPNSSATGIYQFTDGTWADLRKKYPGLGLTADGRTDPEQQKKAFNVFTRDNGNVLQSAGLPPNDRNLYLAHFLGPQGATKFLKSAPKNWSVPAADLVSPEAVKANLTVFFNEDGTPKNALQFYRGVTDKAVAPTDISAQSRVGAPGAAPAVPAGSASVSGPGSDPTLGGLVPKGWAPADYLSALSSLAARQGISSQAKESILKKMEMVGAVMKSNAELTPDQKNYLGDRLPGESQAAYQSRAAGLKSRAELTPEQKIFEQGHLPGESIVDFQARTAGTKKAAEAPYEIAAAAVREGARPIAIKPNEVVTTGGAANPTLEGMTNWALSHLGSPGGPSSAIPPHGLPDGRTFPAPAPPAAPTSAPPAIIPPGTVSPTSQQGADAGTMTGQSVFTPRVVRNPDGSVTSSVTPSTEKIQSAAAEDFGKAHEAFNASQPVQMQLSTLETAFRNLNQSNWSKQGTGANARAELAKAVNSVWQLAGVKDADLPFDPGKIGSWETATKETTRLGFSLARTLGAREAMQIVQGAIKANPSVENTPTGARMVINTIRQNAQRDTDRYTFLTQYAQTHGGDLVGADVAFNKANPPAIYAQRAMVQAQKDIPQEAIDSLKGDPALARDFDAYYGQQGLAKLFIGGGQ